MNILNRTIDALRDSLVLVVSALALMVIIPIVSIFNIKL